MIPPDHGLIAVRAQVGTVDRNLLAVSYVVPVYVYRIREYSELHISSAESNGRKTLLYAFSLPEASMYTSQP